MFRKFIAELLSTLTLVFIGCGSAMLLLNANEPYTMVPVVAIAFGISIVMIAHTYGNVSGAHANPAVSIAAYLDNRIDGKNLGCYIVAQICGAILGSALLTFLFSTLGLVDTTGAYASNVAYNNQIIPSLITEIVLTFLFVICVLGATDPNRNDTKDAGLTIGLTLTAVHLIGIPITGTSVNPARSIGPAIFAAAGGNTKPLLQIWIFILGPIIGAILATIVYKILNDLKCERIKNVCCEYNTEKTIPDEPITFEPEQENEETTEKPVEETIKDETTTEIQEPTEPVI